jgi:hypothetical protein
MAGMTNNEKVTLVQRLARVLGFKSKRARAADLLAARDQAREIEHMAEHAPGHTEDEGEHGGHRYLRP